MRPEERSFGTSLPGEGSGSTFDVAQVQGRSVGASCGSGVESLSGLSLVSNTQNDCCSNVFDFVGHENTDFLVEAVQ